MTWPLAVPLSVPNHDATDAARAAAELRTPFGLQERYLPAVFAYARRRLPRREDAEDAAAETFADAFRHLSRLRRNTDPLPWLLGIAHRKVADVLRRHARRPEVLDSERALKEELRGFVGPHQAIQNAERDDTLRRLVSRLPALQREAILLFYADGLNLAETAAALNRSPAAVNSLLQRARAALRRSPEASYFMPDSEVPR